MKILINDKMNKKQIDELCKLLGDVTEFSVEEEYRGGMSKEKIQEVQKELEEYYKQEDSKRRIF